MKPLTWQQLAVVVSPAAPSLHVAFYIDAALVDAVQLTLTDESQPAVFRQRSENMVFGNAKETPLPYRVRRCGFLVVLRGMVSFVDCSFRESVPLERHTGSCLRLGVCRERCCV